MENIISNYKDKNRFDKNRKNRQFDLDKKEEGFKTINKLLEVISCQENQL